MSTRQRALGVAAIASIFVLSCSAYAYWYFLIRGPLAGDTFFDFGDVPIDDENASIDHVLHLVNRLSHPITISAVRPDCGCLTTARDPRATLQVGEGFDLPVTMVARPGFRRVLIHIDLGDDGVQTLRVQATGVPQTRLATARPVVVMDAAGSAEIEFSALTYGTDAQPPDPVVTCWPKGARAQFLGWRLGYRPRDFDVLPTEWRGRISVQDGAEDATAFTNKGAEETVLSITVNPSKPLTVVVRRPLGE